MRQTLACVDHQHKLLKKRSTFLKTLLQLQPHENCHFHSQLIWVYAIYIFMFQLQSNLMSTNNLWAFFSHALETFHWTCIK